MLSPFFFFFLDKWYKVIQIDDRNSNGAHPLITDLFLFYYEIDFMMSLSGEKEAEIIEAFNSTSRYLDDLLNIDNAYFNGMHDQSNLPVRNQGNITVQKSS